MVVSTPVILGYYKATIKFYSSFDGGILGMLGLGWLELGKFAVDFPEGFALDPLTDGSDKDSGEVKKGESHKAVGEKFPEL